MKTILIAIFICLPFLSKAQLPIIYEDTGYVQKALWAKSLLLPPRDTLPHKIGFALIGNNIWIGNGTKWNLTKSIDSGFFSATYAQRTLGARFNFNRTLMDWDSVKFKFGDTVRVNGKLIGYNVKALGGFETNSFDSTALARASVDAVTGVQLQWASITTSLINSLKIDSLGIKVVGKGSFTDTLKAKTIATLDSSDIVVTTALLKRQGYGGGGSTGWSLTGNAGTTGANFLGTIDDNDFIFKRNGIIGGYIGKSSGSGNTIFGDKAGLWNPGNNNTLFGAEAMSNSPSNSNYNTAIGKETLLNSAGQSNTAIGYKALRSSIYDINNIAIGANAGRYPTNLSNRLYINSIDRVNLTGDTTLSIIYGEQTSAIASQRLKINGQFQLNNGTQGAGKVLTSDANGVSSWQTPSGGGGGSYVDLTTNQTVGGTKTFSNDLSVNSNTIGRGGGNVLGNLALGYLSLAANTTGTDNLAIGSYTLNGNNGSNNVGVGTSVMQNTTSGATNTGIGSLSLFLNTTGYENVAIGSQAARSVSTGYGNVGVGTYSLFNALQSENVGVGTYSLFNMGNGVGNTALGFQAGQYITGFAANTSADNSIYIGRQARGFSVGQDNEIVIGALATGAGSNSVTLGNTSITKTLLNGNVGIGITSPTEKVEIDGSLKTKHIIGSTSAPTIAVGAALGTGGTASISGTDIAGNVTLNIGTSPPVTTPGLGLTVTFNTSYTVAPKSVILTAANEFAQESYFNGGWFVDLASITTTEFKIYQYSRGNAYPSTTMKFFYQVIQ